MRRGMSINPKARMAARLPAIDVGDSRLSPASSAAAGSLAAIPPEGALVVGSSAQPSTLQLRFLRLENNELLLSRVKGAPMDQCTRYPTSMLRGLEHINDHTFQIRCAGAPPLRFEAHDAYTNKAWEHILGQALDKAAMLVPSPTTIPARHSATATSGGSGSLSPRPSSLFQPSKVIKSTQPATVGVDVGTALSRGWHINTGQRGLKQLGSLEPYVPRSRKVITKSGSSGAVQLDRGFAEEGG
jgi:hypothetical protein